MANLVVENGEAKNRRRTLRPLAKAASIMDIVEATEDGVVAEVDTEDEDMVEAVNMAEVVEDTAVEVTRLFCSNCSFAMNDLNDKRAFFALYKNPTCTTVFLLASDFKSSYSSFKRASFSLLATKCEILETWLDVFEFLFPYVFFFIAHLYHQDHELDRMRGEITI